MTAALARLQRRVDRAGAWLIGAWHGLCGTVRFRDPVRTRYELAVMVAYLAGVATGRKVRKATGKG